MLTNAPGSFVALPLQVFYNVPPAITCVRLILRFDFDITTKGLFLISIPIISELLLVFVLVTLVNRADQIALAEHRKKTLVMEMHEVGLQVYEELNVLIAYYTSREAKLLERFAAIDKTILDRLQNIETTLALSSDSSSEKLQRNFRIAGQNLVKEIRECRDNLLRTSDNPDAARWLHIANSVRSSAATFLKATDALVLVQVQARKLSHAGSVQDARNLVRYALFASVLVNILIALYLTIFFSGSISRRVNCICDNIKKIPEGAELKHKLDGSDELATIDQFVHDVSRELKEKDEQRNAILSMVGHDLRSPLSAAQMSLEVMASGGYGDVPSTVQSRISSIVAILNTLTRMIRDLLDTENLRTGRFTITPTRMDLKPICEESRNTLLSLAESRKLKIELNCESVEADVDADRMLQVLNNLISNAVKFSPPNTTITVSLARRDSLASILIEDQGPGIKPEEVALVFQRFYQTGEGKRVIGSMGLGLHICKEIVSKHGGRIGAEGLPERGSRFWIELPAAPESP